MKFESNQERQAVLQSASETIMLFQAVLHLLDNRLQTLSMALHPAAEPGQDEPVPVIYLSPTQRPTLEFSDRVGVFDSTLGYAFVQDQDTGLMAAYLEDECMNYNDVCYLIGPVILFQCDEDGALCAVSSAEYQAVLEVYSSKVEMLPVGTVKIPAIEFHPTEQNIL